MAFFGIYNILCHVMELVIHPGNINIPKISSFAKMQKVLIIFLIGSIIYS